MSAVVSPDRWDSPTPSGGSARDATLPDGRRLGYAETGDPDGDPVLAFHGIPSGRLGAAVFDRVAREHGSRLLDPERFPRVAVPCGVGPPAAAGMQERLLFLSARDTPGVVRTLLRVEELSGRYAPERTLKRGAAAGAPRDREIRLGEVGRLVMAAGLSARQHHGNDTFVRDLQLYAGDWKFDMAAIDVPVGLWYGRADRFVPVAMGRYLMDAVPTAEAHFYPDLGHLSTVVENEAAIFAWLSQ